LGARRQSPPSLDSLGSAGGHEGQQPEAAQHEVETAMNRRPEECQDLSHVRVEIDRCDKALVDMIAERFGYVERAWQIKLGLKQEANVPWRNQQVIDRVRAQASERGVPPDLCEALWRQMIGWFIQYEEEKLRGDIEAQGGAGSGQPAPKS
jgi:isochorismate pyruvate lyase